MAYTNVKCNVQMFADKTKIYSSLRDDQIADIEFKKSAALVQGMADKMQDDAH